MQGIFNRFATGRNLLRLAFPILGTMITTWIAFAQPAPRKIFSADTLHGDIRVDYYAWLKEKENPDVITYLERENAYADSLMKPTEALQEQIYQEMVSHIKETDVDVPYPDGGYYYYNRTEEGKQYRIRCRKKGNLDAPEEILMDENVMAAKYGFFSVGSFSASPDHSIAGVSIDTSGYEAYDLSFMNLATKEWLADRIPDVTSVVWASDNKTVFYGKRDHARRPYRIFRHTLGTDPATDKMVFEDKDELFNVYAWRSKNDKFVFFVTESSNSAEAWYLPADKPESDAKLILARRAEHEYNVDTHGDDFYIMTNAGAKNFRLVKAPVSDPSEANWTEVIAHRPDVTLESFDLTAGNLIVVERAKGLQQVRITDLGSGESHYVEFPEPVYSVFQDVNRVFDTKLFRFRYQSFTTPSSVYDYDMTTKARTLLKMTEVPGYDPGLYTSERIFARAADGVEVPISLVYKKDTPRDGTAPLHLTGYGSYGSSSNVTFSSNRLSLLDRGYILAIGHIRGGGDLGRDWKDEGKLLKKKNTFTDFIACAEHLVAQRYTSKDRLTIEGGSAGGLLIGAVVNMRPDLYKAALAMVPFVDVLNTMLDPDLPLTVGEYLEWGNPNEKVYYDYMKTYCPYTNVAAKDYPNLLVRVGLNDPRVGYWEGVKWAARMREMKTDDHNIIVKVNMGAGHGGASGRYSRLKEIAFNYAYVLSQNPELPPAPPVSAPK